MPANLACKPHKSNVSEHLVDFAASLSSNTTNFKMQPKRKPYQLLTKINIS